MGNQDEMQLLKIMMFRKYQTWSEEALFTITGTIRGMTNNEIHFGKILFDKSFLKDKDFKNDVKYFMEILVKDNMVKKVYQDNKFVGWKVTQKSVDLYYKFGYREW